MENPTAMLSSNKQDWETPKEFFEKLDQEFEFTVDVCANDQNAKCNRYYTERQNGLSQDWSKDICWLNPPYARGEQSKWIHKAYTESLKGATVVCLVPARPDTKVWHEIIFPYAEIRFLKGRIKFVGADQPCPFPCAVVIFGEKIDQGLIKVMAV